MQSHSELEAGGSGSYSGRMASFAGASGSLSSWRVAAWLGPARSLGSGFEAALAGPLHPLCGSVPHPGLRARHLGISFPCHLNSCLGIRFVVNWVWP